jgi:hypothetical protein
VQRQKIFSALGCAGLCLLILGIGIFVGVALNIVADWLWLPKWVGWAARFIGIFVAIRGIVYLLEQYAHRQKQDTLEEQASTDFAQIWSSLSRPQRFAYWYCIVGVGLLVIVGMLFTMLVMHRFAPIIQRAIYQHPTDVFFIPVDPWASGLIGIFLGILISGLFSDSFVRWLAGEHWDAIKPLIYYPLGESLSLKLNRYFLWGIGILFVVQFLTIDCYTRITPEGFYFNRFWSLTEKFYPISEVEVVGYITQYKHRVTGQIRFKEDPYYEIRFRDGFTFSSAQTAFRNSAETMKLIRWLQQKHPVPVREVTLGVDWE